LKFIPHSRPFLDEEEIETVKRVLYSGYIAQGREVEKFEKKISRLTESKSACALCNGTTALRLTLEVLGIGKGEEVVLPDYTCTALLYAVLSLQAKPKIVDILSSHLQLDVEKFHASIGSRVKAVILPYMFGIIPKVEVYRREGVYLIEDGAQALGTKKIGKIGKALIYSFYATKMITTGEGGMVCSDETSLIEKIKDLREYDKKDEYSLRFNYKMTDIQAAIGVVQVEKVAGFIRRRKKIQRYYDDFFLSQELAFKPAEIEEWIPFRYLIKLSPETLDKVEKEYYAYGIEVKKPVYQLLHRYLKLPDNLYPESVKCYNSILSLPLYPALKDEEVEKVVESSKKIFKKKW